MKKRMFFTILGLAIVLGGIFGFQAYVSHQIEQAMQNQAAPAVVVSAAEAQTDTWQPTVSAVGTLSAVQGVDITAEVAGRVVDVAVEDGARVEQGDILVRLDSEAAQAELRGLQAEARLAQIELDRQRRLQQQNANSQADVDRAESQLQQARSRVEAQQATLDEKVIEAPFGGRLGILQVDVGQVLSAGQAIVTLQSLAPIDIDFSVPQKELARLQAGQPVEVRVDAFADDQFEGRITAISPKITENTRSASIRGRIANERQLLRPGMFADVAVRLPETRDVITLPQTAITYNPYGNSVFLVREQEGDDGETTLVAERTLIQTGAERGSQVQVTRGIEPGDQVVTSGQHKLRDGATVEINNSVTPPSDPSPQLGNH